MPNDSFIIAEARALEALAHNADRTFISPSDLLHLIHSYRKVDWENKQVNWDGDEETHSNQPIDPDA